MLSIMGLFYRGRSGRITTDQIFEGFSNSLSVDVMLWISVL